MSQDEHDGLFWSTRDAAKHLGMSRQKFLRLRRHDPDWLPVARVTGHDSCPKFWFLVEHVETAKRQLDGIVDNTTRDAMAYTMFRHGKEDADVVIALKRPPRRDPRPAATV